MFSKKIVFSFYSGTILFFLLFFYSLKKINASLKSSIEYNNEKKDYIDLENEEQMKQIYMKIRHYKSIERDPIQHITTYSLEEEKSKQLRTLETLETSNIFEDITLIDATQFYYYLIANWFSRSQTDSQSNVILYPYSFDHNYTDEKNNTITKHYKQGAFISLKPSEIDRFFFSLKENGTFYTQRSRALIDADIAILSIEASISNYNEELFQDGVDWGTFLHAHFLKGACLQNYEEFYDEKIKNPMKKYTTKLNEKNIQNGVLLENGIPRFGALIIPDYILGTDDIIKAKLGENGKNRILDYYNKGGTILISGKSGVLFEDFGLISKGTYNRNKLLNIENTERKVLTKGCEDTFNKQYEEGNDDIIKQIICLRIDKNYKAGLSTTFKTIKEDTTFNTIFELDPEDKDLVLTDTESGLSDPLTEEEKKFNPLVMYKSNANNGKLFIMNLNPFVDEDFALPFNVMMMILSKELFFTSKINLGNIIESNEELPIPAGEMGLELEIDTLLHNLNDKKITKFKLYFFLADNFDWKNIPSSCIKKNNLSILPISVKNKKTLESENDYLECNLETINPYEKINLKNTIIILNYLATQMKYQVSIIQIISNYIDSTGKEDSMIENIIGNCQPAPQLRASINPDPSSHYPLFGQGDYSDNVLRIENKEEGKAYDLEYIEMIPLISPIVDSLNQQKINHYLRFYSDYYNKYNFEVPFTSPNATDYIYTSELNNKGVYIGFEFESTILPVKEMNPKVKSGEQINITGINEGLIIVETTSQIIKQINYRKSDYLYKLGTQRLMVYVDDTTPEGAKTLYGDNINKDIRDPILENVAKKEFAFVRIDIFFYDNINYHNPPEVDKNTFITIDKLQEYQKNKENCSKIREFSKEFKVVEGYFNNFDEDENKRKKILEPTIYGNTFFDYCYLNIVNPLDKDSIVNNFGNTDNFKLIHYIVPNIDENIKQPSQIVDFVEETKYFGYHKTYSSIKFIYLHYAEFTIINTTCVYGGRISVYLDKYKINSIDDVTFSPEQIAIYNVSYNENENKITAYFKRGLNPNEQFGKNMKNKIFIENISSSDNLTFNISIEEVKYDISFPPNFERYSTLNNEIFTFNYISAFSFPALEIRTKLNRTVNQYEVIEPFNKYGLYFQEIGHRTVYSSGEIHQEKRPGLVMPTTYSIITGLGISWVPFNEYLRVGYLFIPSTQTTSRIIWKDIWGRTWQQPLRSIFFDGPPLKGMNNLMMTTTYEVLNKKELITEWPSDENVQIHLHIKLLNNFLKLFDIISCKENEMNYMATTFDRLDYLQKVRTIENNVSYEVKKEDYNGNNMFIRQGVYTSYGVCYSHPDSIVGGKKIGNTYLEDVKKASLCSEKTSENEIAQCIEELKNIPTLNKAPSDYNETERWNYSPLVEKYYPKDYINDDMWNMAFFDYEDTPYEKSFNKHFEVLLPNFDNGEIKPENIISIPIYKGLGYNITYNKSQEMNYHGETKRGWWSDNLQNKDDTLLAGNNVSNLISVDKKSEIKWVNVENLVGSKKEGSTELVKELIANKTKNLYACLFNRRRPEYNLESNKKFDPMSIVENNVIPIFVDLEKNDKRLYFYDCKDEQYTSENITLVEGNLLKTSTSKDYLYFSSNLRGGAKETLNILMNLNFFPKIIYEGIAKINEGSRFVYWQSGNLVNSYLTVDNPAHFITAKRNDFTIINRLYNPKTTTFNVTLYHSHIIRDDNKINKEWPYSDYYINSYGFGDVSITVSVGGFKKSKPSLQPGETTYAKIVFYNNCGFDWNMKVGAIKFEYKGSIPYNSYQLLRRFVHAIQLPLEYCFLNYIIEEPYRQYITIKPSDHNIEVSPEFFDFENINVVTIRDAFKGEYYLKITVLEDFPDNLRGKPIEIKIELNTTYFDHFPGTDTDPILKYHNNYNISIPSLYIAVPFKDGEFKNKVLYTSAQAYNFNYFYAEFLDSTVEGVKYINKTILEKLENTTGKDDQIKELEEIWNSLENEKSLEINVYQANSERKIVEIIGFAKDFPLFPKKVIGKPDIAEVILLIKTHLTQLRKGGSYPIFFPRLDYKDWSGKGKRNVGDSLIADARGAWLSLSYGRKLVDQIGEHIYADSPIQELSPEDEGIMQVQFKLQNTGNGISYKTKYEIIIEPGLEYYDHRKGIEKISEKKIETGQTILTFDLKSSINPGELKGGIIYLKYHKINNDSEILELKIANESSAILDLTDKGDNQVTQHLRQPLSFVYKKQKKIPVFIHLIVSGTRKNPSVKIEPKIKYFEDEKEKDYDIYKFKASLSNYNETNNEKKEIDETTDLIYENLTSSKDKPCSNNKCKKSNIIYYNVLIIKKNGTTTATGKIKFDKSKIGISTSEKVLISLSVFFFAISILFIILAILRIRLYCQGDLTSKIEDTQLSNLLNE